VILEEAMVGASYFASEQECEGLKKSKSQVTASEKYFD